MRPIVIILVAVALTIAGLTALLMSRWVSGQKAATQVSQQMAGPPTEQVLVAAVDLKPGAIVKGEDLRYQAWPANALDPRAIRRTGGDDPKSTIVGTIARRPVMAGEPITPQSVFRQDEAGVLAGMLSPGMRAVTVSVSSTSGVGGFVLPEDHVDIVLNQDIRAATSRGGEAARADIARFSSEVILSDVRVLAVDDKLTKADTAANMAGKTVTLELTPKDAEILLISAKMGDITLTLRSLAPGEVGQPSASSYTSDVEVSRALQAATGLGPAAHPAPEIQARPAGNRVVRVNRAGATSMQSFSN